MNFIVIMCNSQASGNGNIVIKNACVRCHARMFFWISKDGRGGNYKIPKSTWKQQATQHGTVRIMVTL